MSQRTVNAGGMSIGFAGQIADSNWVLDIVSGFSAEASAQIPFGFGLMALSGVPDSYVLPSGASGTMEIQGISVLGLNHSRGGGVDADGNFFGDLGASGLLPKASLQVMRKGRVLVPVEHNVRIGDRPYCRVTATGALTPGSWVGTNYGGSYVRDCTTQGRFISLTSTAADGVTKVAVLEVDFNSKP